MKAHIIILPGDGIGPGGHPIGGRRALPPWQPNTDITLSLKNT